MKAKVKSLGSVTDLSEYIYDEDGNQYTWDELELIDDDKWQHYRIQAAIAAMQGMVISDAYCNEEPVGPAYQIKRRKWAPARIAQEAVAYADFLIAELQKKGGKDETAK